MHDFQSAQKMIWSDVESLAEFLYCTEVSSWISTRQRFWPKLEIRQTSITRNNVKIAYTAVHLLSVQDDSRYAGVIDFQHARQQI